ncbi:metallophosphoesterase [Curvibacter sp. APW13]|uniref:metallophosphoesterase n=1 Tax=Curvibacter sp. APW13 TaxID=3077236 RepID=UPI0028DE3989|nr:metallophosphoesterase [Curvibacter sp. APW13]MDT8990239.1 metallophosphoesterase [Curvibacter sp. APW13]
MKIQLLSDLHLETHPDWRSAALPDADVLVLAGDIGSYQAGSRLAGMHFGLEHFSPLNGWPTPVLFVPGNHEYDGMDFDEAHARLRSTCRALGIHWLERETLVIDGVRFVGTTLWTDFDALGGDEKARTKAFRAANYYLQKTGTTRAGLPWLAEGIREQALSCQQWLRSALQAPFDGPTVVVTHFAPSLHSADPRYGRTPGTAGFCNELDELLHHARLWLHGHLHAPSDYVHRGCRVVANPLGYRRKGEQQHHRPNLLIDMDDLPTLFAGGPNYEDPAGR